MKPMLAAKIEVIRQIHFPAWCTPKIDGIRCLTMSGGDPVSRKLLDIPNTYIRESIKSYGVEGLDGELYIPSMTFNDVSGSIMRESGEPDFEYLIFDLWNMPGVGYLDRVAALDNLPKPRPPWFKLLKPVEVFDEEGFKNYWTKCLADGYEGVCARAFDGIYKYGRSTKGEQLLMKYKHFEDSEAIVIGFEELMHNNNPATTDELGHTKRSSAKAGKVPGGKLGKLLVREKFTGIEFEVGSGFTDKERRNIWSNRDVWLGETIKYKHQPSGAKEKPRFPTFLGFRHPGDM